jgi:hypothetical protein
MLRYFTPRDKANTQGVGGAAHGTSDSAAIAAQGEGAGSSGGNQNAIPAATVPAGDQDAMMVDEAAGDGGDEAPSTRGARRHRTYKINPGHLEDYDWLRKLTDDTGYCECCSWNRQLMEPCVVKGGKDKIESHQRSKAHQQAVARYAATVVTPGLLRYAAAAAC